MQKELPTLNAERITMYAQYLYEQERAARTIRKYTHAPASAQIAAGAVSG